MISDHASGSGGTPAGCRRSRARYIQELQSRRLAVVMTEQATEPVPASYRARFLVGCDDPIAETLMISFKVAMRTEMLN